MSDPFAQALYDYHYDEMEQPLLYRRGEQTQSIAVDFYFDDVDLAGGWLESCIDGPLLDLGAGVGRHARPFQAKFETVAVERSGLLVEVLRDRGVEAVRHADMFDLRAEFDANSFESVIALGTQVGLVRSLVGLETFLGDLAAVTTDDATAVFDGYDPQHERTRQKLDYYDDPARGLAYRLLQVEYDGVLGEPWLYRLFTPDRVREVATGTVWMIDEVHRGPEHLYQVVLRKR